MNAADKQVAEARTGRRHLPVLLDLIAERQVGWEGWLADPFAGARLVTFLNPYSYSRGRRTQELYEKFDLIGVDGIGLCLLMRMIPHLPTPVRRSADLTSIVRDLLTHSGAKGRSWYLVGGEEGVAARAAERLQALFPEMEIAGTRSGYFATPQDWDRFSRDIAQASPDITLLGMGTPLQDIAALKLRESGVTGTIMTCGGFLGQTAGSAVFYPPWMDRLHLRWLYRAFREPHVRTRLVRDYPVGSALVLRDGWSSLLRSGL